MYDFGRAADRPTLAMCHTITGTQRQSSSAPYHHQCTDNSSAFGGSAQITSGGIGSDEDAWRQFLLKEVSPEDVKKPVIPVTEVRTPKTEV